MSKNTNGWCPEDAEEIEKRSLIQKYLRNPFSITWLKLTIWVQNQRVSNLPEAPGICQSERSELDSTQEQDLYLRFTDRVDPSIYYSLFFPHQWY